MSTIYISTRPEFWGSDATEEDALAAASRMQDELMADWPGFMFELTAVRWPRDQIEEGDELEAEWVRQWINDNFHEFAG
jgi:hypothetical protein